MAMMTAGGIRLHYYRRGAAQQPHVVLVHGLAANIAFWFPQVLPALARDYLVTAYDLRGHGRSDMPTSGYGTNEMIADLHALIGHSHKTPVHLIGHSYGGAVALHYAIRHPANVASVTVADTRLGAFQATDHLADWLSASVRRPSVEQSAATVTADPAGVDGLSRSSAPGAVAAGTAGANRSGPFARMGKSSISGRTAERWHALLCDTSASPDLLTAPGPAADELAQISAPVLAIYGERSDFLPSWHGLRHRLSRCQAAIVPGAGHFHPRGRPDLFVREVGGFLERVTTVGKSPQ